MRVYEFNSEASRADGERVIFLAGRITLCLVFALILQPKARAAQAASPGAPTRQEAVGRLSGDDVSVTGAISFESGNGRTTALLASGSELTLRSGQAKIDLPEGGAIILCGPAHLSVLKSGATITVAVDYGQVHLQVGPTTLITIYTPLLVVTPENIGNRERDLTVGLDQRGELCVTALFGAVRLAEQFTGESLIVPQGGDVEIEGGELRGLRSGSRKCSCELLVSESSGRKEIETRLSPNGLIAARPPESSNSTTYRIEMPPLTFEASSAAIGGALPSEAVSVIRESVEDPRLSFRGDVRSALPPPPGEPSRRVSRSRNAGLRFFARLWGVFHHRRQSAEQSAAARPGGAVNPSHFHF